MATSTTFYRFRGSVARIVHDETGVSVAIYDRARDAWIDFPAIYGRLTGAGGDPPLDVLTRDQARAIIDGKAP